MQLKLISNRFSKHFRRLKVKQGKIQKRSNHQFHPKSHKMDPDVVLTKAKASTPHKANSLRKVVLARMSFSTKPSKKK